jgi:hypothetical protein
MNKHEPVRRHRRAAADADEDDQPEMSLADVVERMFALFEAQLSLATIVRVVRRCRRELDIRAVPLSTVSLEGMAHERLSLLAQLNGSHA